jgi:hypothetical protein
VDGSDRIELTWDNKAIMGTWLWVHMKGNTAPNKMLPDDTFYVGSAPGKASDTGNAIVGPSDETIIRGDPRNYVNAPEITNPHDVNRDKRVDTADMEIVRNHNTDTNTCLQMITAP